MMHIRGWLSKLELCDKVAFRVIDQPIKEIRTKNVSSYPQIMQMQFTFDNLVEQSSYHVTQTIVVCLIR